MRPTILALVAVLGLVVAWSSFFVLDETELAIVTRFGEFIRTVDKPGLHFKTPVVQLVSRMDRRVQGSDTPPAEYLTLDKKRLMVDPMTRWKVRDALLFYKSVHDESGAKARLDDIINSELRREIASQEFGQIVGNARGPMMDLVSTRTRDKAVEFGIEIVDVRIKRADLPREVQESVYARMRAERDRVAKQYRSEGEEEAAKVRADTDKEQTILLAKAYETSETLRGQGDAESSTIYASAYGKDPEFYSFLRSLDAYEKSLGARSTLVLSADTELFRYFASPGKRARK